MAAKRYGFDSRPSGKQVSFTSPNLKGSSALTFPNTQNASIELLLPANNDVSNRELIELRGKPSHEVT